MESLRYGTYLERPSAPLSVRYLRNNHLSEPKFEKIFEAAEGKINLINFERINWQIPSQKK
jgi:hypothetical protein